MKKEELDALYWEFLKNGLNLKITSGRLFGKYKDGNWVEAIYFWSFLKEYVINTDKI